MVRRSALRGERGLFGPFGPRAMVVLVSDAPVVGRTWIETAGGHGNASQARSCLMSVVEDGATIVSRVRGYLPLRRRVGIAGVRIRERGGLQCERRACASC